jgi:hypothetical protein
MATIFCHYATKIGKNIYSSKCFVDFFAKVVKKSPHRK